MSDVVRLLGAFLLSGAVSAGATPIARAIAVRTEFFDHPAGYKEHFKPTPYLGGASLTAGLLAGAGVFAHDVTGRAALLGGILGLFVIGTIDDRVRLGVLPRFGAQVVISMIVWATGSGWDLFDLGAANLAVTLFWVVGLINAMNLMDNLDGAVGTVGGISAVGVAAVAVAGGDPIVAALALALAGSCAGFLPFNLARPSRIFLGDGGSMPIGFVLAFCVMQAPASGLGWTALLASVPLAGVLILDTTLVVISRRRRGADILSGARDHTTHRLLPWAGSARMVALWLGAAQAVLCGLAVGLHELDEGDVIVATVGYVVLGGLAIRALERPATRVTSAEQAL